MKSPDKDPTIRKLLKAENGWHTFSNMSPRLFNFYNSLYLNQIKNYIWERLPSFKAMTDMGWWKKWFTIKKQEAKKTEEIQLSTIVKANEAAQFKETQAQVDRKAAEKAKDKENREALRAAYAAITEATNSLSHPRQIVTSPTSAPKLQIDTRRTSNLEELIEAGVVKREYIDKLKVASSSPIDSKEREYARQDLAFLQNNKINNQNKKYYADISPSFTDNHRKELRTILEALKEHDPNILNRALDKGFKATVEALKEAAHKKPPNLGH
jgi:hypothetical protein